MSGYKVNDLMYVVYWRADNSYEWSVSQPVTLGELIDNAELDFGDDDDTGGSLPINDIDWGRDEVLFYPVPPRKYAQQDTTKPSIDVEGKGAKGDE